MKRKEKKKIVADARAAASTVARRIHAHWTRVHQPNCQTCTFLVVAAVDYMHIFRRHVVHGEIEPSFSLRIMNPNLVTLVIQDLKGGKALKELKDITSHSRLIVSC